MTTADTLRQHGNELFNKKEYHAAIDAYSEALLVDPANIAVLCNRALCYIRVGMPLVPYVIMYLLITHRLSPSFVQSNMAVLWTMHLVPSIWSQRMRRHSTDEVLRIWAF